MQVKPNKKTDKELFALCKQKIATGDYLFVKHAKDRQQQRCISDLDVLAILEGKPGRSRKRNVKKDCYNDKYHDWNYCVEGVDIDGKKIRVIVSFMNGLMPIITVMRL